MNVSDVMTAQVVTVKPSSSITEVAQVMARIESGAVPVADDGKVVGLITDRDIVLRVVAEGRGPDTTVADVMSGDVATCAENDSVADAVGMMGARQIRRLIVLDAGGGMAGILSLGDIALDYGSKAVGHALEEISENSPSAH